LWLVGAAFCVTKITIKQGIHESESEALTRRLKALLCLFQLVCKDILVISIVTTPTIQACLNEAIPPCTVKVVALDTDDKVVQNDAHMSPHDDVKIYVSSVV
jgi:hypothetical protein